MTAVLKGKQLTREAGTPAENGRRSAENMWESWLCQPRRERKADISSREPMVKHTANLDGASITTGRKSVKARMRNSRPAPSRAQKYVRLVVDSVGNLQEHGSVGAGAGVRRCPGMPSDVHQGKVATAGPLQSNELC